MVNLRPLVALSLLVNRWFRVQASFSDLRIRGSGQTLNDTQALLLSNSLRNDELPPNLTINDIPLTPYHVSWLSEAVAGSKSLAYLSLTHTDLDHEGLRILIDGLVASTSLKIIDLSNNNVGDLGALALAERMHTMSFEHLSLCNNQIGLVGHVALDRYWGRIDLD